MTTASWADQEEALLGGMEDTADVHSGSLAIVLHDSSTLLHAPSCEVVKSYFLTGFGAEPVSKIAPTVTP